MKFFCILLFFNLWLCSAAQKSRHATLRLVYPVRLTYDTLFVKNSAGKTLKQSSNFSKGGIITKTYLLKLNSLNQFSFFIYFGGSNSAVNDSLYFLARGSYFQIDIKDSFALRDHINFKLKNLYNFEELYKRYNEFLNFKIQKYSSFVNHTSTHKLSLQEYSLRQKLDFVKMNINNPYAIDLFAFFIIGPHQSYIEYKEIYPFYLKTLKNKIKDPKFGILVAHKIELLKQSLKEGNMAPNYSARSIQNRLIQSDSLLGKNVLLIFWATWCLPCKMELPYLKEINEEYKNDNLVIISVSLDKDSIKLANMIREEKLNWMQIFNNRTMIESFRINPIPEIFLIDEKGKIAYNKLNRENETDDLGKLKSLLKEKFQH